MHSRIGHSLTRAMQKRRRIPAPVWRNLNGLTSNTDVPVPSSAASLKGLWCFTNFELKRMNTLICKWPSFWRTLWNLEQRGQMIALKTKRFLVVAILLLLLNLVCTWIYLNMFWSILVINSWTYMSFKFQVSDSPATDTQWQLCRLLQVPLWYYNLSFPPFYAASQLRLAATWHYWLWIVCWDTILCKLVTLRKFVFFFYPKGQTYCMYFLFLHT